MNRISALYAIAIATLTTAVVITGALLVSYEENQVMAYSRAYGKGNFTFGTISSIQNDESGNPAWVVSGHWKGNLLSNQSNVTSQGNISSSSGPTFNASVEMIMLNGTAAHTHTITNFVLANTSMPNNMTRIFNGTSTASMREGPVTDIPTGISIMGDKVISIWLDPSKINNHFGNTPIYGTVMNEHGDRQGYSKGNNTQMESNIWSK
ncbi:MAG: uncharacterized protein K0R16_25 [Nitrososphaeraceae archaeon]|jgi:hypothetical protein|nr:uncharacterized protein [Nitrososphaeraceae archaeon]MDF2767870.1 uncharacterized protein [Nitrososphaeraceae archaeon]